MEQTQYQKDLEKNGYAIIENVLSKEQIEQYKDLFYKWQKTIPNHDDYHRKCSPHGIYKFYEVGHTRFAWLIRINPKIQKIFKTVWDCDDLVVSFDGCCYISPNDKRKNKIWTHTDQAPSKKGLQCYQGWVSLTDNEERTLVVYEGSHKLHENYFKEKNLSHNKNWNLIDLEYLYRIKHTRKALKVKAGSLVLWDSRCFHQNQYGNFKSFKPEERIVQYICYLPKNHKKNTKAMQKKRLKYFNERRTTSHWPCPIKVNSKQPRTYGNKDMLIDYSKIQRENFDDILEEIKKII